MLLIRFIKVKVICLIKHHAMYGSIIPCILNHDMIQKYMAGHVAYAENS